MIAAALLLQAAAQPAPPTLGCELRTPAGDTLAWRTLAIRAGGEKLPTLFLEAVAGSAWPPTGKIIIALPIRAAGDEIEFQAGPHLLRIGVAGALRNATILSTRGDKPAQATAFGFCNGTAPAAIATTAAREPFEPSRWKEQCFLTAPGGRRGSFALDQALVAGEMMASFTPREGDLWPGPVRVPRQVLRNGPRSEAAGITLGVGRFAPRAGESGPTGMDMIYIDEAAKRASIVVRFNTFDGTNQPGFAICGVPSFKESRR